MNLVFITFFLKQQIFYQQPLIFIELNTYLILILNSMNNYINIINYSRLHLIL